MWQSIGGPMAWSEQIHMLNIMEFQLRVANWRNTEEGQKNRNPPKVQTPPPYSHEKRAEETRQSAKSAAWEARQARTRQPEPGVSP